VSAQAKPISEVVKDFEQISRKPSAFHKTGVRGGRGGSQEIRGVSQIGPTGPARSRLRRHYPCDRPLPMNTLSLGEPRFASTLSHTTRDDFRFSIANSGSFFKPMRSIRASPLPILWVPKLSRCSRTGTTALYLHVTARRLAQVRSMAAVPNSSLISAQSFKTMRSLCVGGLPTGLRGDVFFCFLIVTERGRYHHARCVTKPPDSLVRVYGVFGKVGRTIRRSLSCYTSSFALTH
jgi:hypothetical protein